MKSELVETAAFDTDITCLPFFKGWIRIRIFYLQGLIWKLVKKARAMRVKVSPSNVRNPSIIVFLLTFCDLGIGKFLIQP